MVPNNLYFQVIERSEIENLDPELALTFFKKKVYPNALRVYQVEQATESEAKLPASGEPLLVDLLVRCIEVYKVPVKQVLLLIWVIKGYEAFTYTWSVS